MSENQEGLGGYPKGQKWALTDRQGLIIEFMMSPPIPDPKPPGFDLARAMAAPKEGAFAISDAVWMEWAAAGRTKRWDGSKLIAAPPPAPAFRFPISISSAAIWEALSNEESDALDAELKRRPIREQRIWAETPHFMENTESFALAREIMVSALGEKRTVIVMKG